MLSQILVTRAVFRFLGTNGIVRDSLLFLLIVIFFGHVVNFGVILHQLRKTKNKHAINKIGDFQTRQFCDLLPPFLRRRRAEPWQHDEGTQVADQVRRSSFYARKGKCSRNIVRLLVGTNTGCSHISPSPVFMQLLPIHPKNGKKGGKGKRQEGGRKSLRKFSNCRNVPSLSEIHTCSPKVLDRLRKLLVEISGLLFLPPPFPWLNGPIAHTKKRSVWRERRLCVHWNEFLCWHSGTGFTGQRNISISLGCFLGTQDQMIATKRQFFSF